jgi:eukaryotic-like serine/threonine-protein kinase
MDMIGRTLGHYRLESLLGQGGMGVVYRARDLHLDRWVAVKVLPPDRLADPERQRRFAQEARAASALNHPNILHIYDIGRAAEVDFIAMELVDGRPLDELIGPHGLPVTDALAYAIQLANALTAAHAAGIIHRDIKPSNVLVTGAGLVKVVDFGVAKLTRTPAQEAAATMTAPALTQVGSVLGTIAYMAPEQAEGRGPDARADLFSFGAVLYEMLAGRRAFTGDSPVSVLKAVLQDEPPPLTALRPDVPAELVGLVAACLEKDPERRCASAPDVCRRLTAVGARLAGELAGRLARRPARALAVTAALLLLGMGAAAAWSWLQTSRERWVRRDVLPEIQRLLDEQDFHAAFRLAREVGPYLPGEPLLERIWRDYALPLSIRTEPPGVDVHIKDYLAPAGPDGWAFVGRSPLERILVPLGPARVRLTKAGFETVEALVDTPVLARTLDPAGTAPPGMVRVPGGSYQLAGVVPVRLDDYWLDRYEVSNRAFKAFVDQRGYERSEYWQTSLAAEGVELAWDAVVARFGDATGRPGPATWELGTYPEGEEEYPVAGVSWFEAAAYCRSQGKGLPTIYHWFHATGALAFSEVASVSNFGGRGPAPIGRHDGMGPAGTYDMAGNVREWCWNASGAGRYLLGGAWNDPAYAFGREYALSPWDRSATNGIRCASHPAPVSEQLTAPVDAAVRDYTREAPASDEVFRTYASLYAYDRSDPGARVESVEDSSAHWRREKVTLDAAYGRQRLPVYLFLPKNSDPPYQTLVYFPTTLALFAQSSEALELQFIEFLMRSGRSVAYPVYSGTYERRSDPAPEGSHRHREQVVQRFQDLARTLDYLETRRDIDAGRLVFYGYSFGALEGVIALALEPRLAAGALLGGGFSGSRPLPEVDPFHFAPRVRQPVLMVNGRDDFRRPPATSQRPLFTRLGTPPADKDHILLDGGHVPYRFQEVIREILTWLDRQVGRVPTGAARGR